MTGLLGTAGGAGLLILWSATCKRLGPNQQSRPQTWHGHFPRGAHAAAYVGTTHIR